MMEKKIDIVAGQQILSSKSGLEILLFNLEIAFELDVFKNYNSQIKSLQFFGTTLQLSENKGSEGTEKSGRADSKEGAED